MTISQRLPSAGDVQPIENGCFTGSSTYGLLYVGHSDRKPYLLKVCLPFGAWQ